MSTYLYLRALLEARLEPKPLKWVRASAKEIGDGASNSRLAALVSMASRHVKRRALELGDKERRAAHDLCPGWSPERWSTLDAARVFLILARPDLAEESGVLAVDELFRYADEGELCALYRGLALLPDGERFLERAREGCRTNMRSVFEATALDTPYPARHFDEPAWNQLAIKCLFIGAPVWRLWDLDQRLSPELARMALDLADERRSAERPVAPELWLCLGTDGGKRGLESLALELERGNPNRLGRRAAILALGRAGATEQLEALRDADDPEPETVAAALAGETGQAAFRDLHAE